MIWNWLKSIFFVGKVLVLVVSGYLVDRYWCRFCSWLFVWCWKIVLYIFFMFILFCWVMWYNWLFLKWIVFVMGVVLLFGVLKLFRKGGWFLICWLFFKSSRKDLIIKLVCLMYSFWMYWWIGMIFWSRWVIGCWRGFVNFWKFFILLNFGLWSGCILC